MSVNTVTPGDIANSPLLTFGQKINSLFRLQFFKVKNINDWCYNSSEITSTVTSSSANSGRGFSASCCLTASCSSRFLSFSSSCSHFLRQFLMCWNSESRMSKKSSSIKCLILIKNNSEEEESLKKNEQTTLIFCKNYYLFSSISLSFDSFSEKVFEKIVFFLRFSRKMTFFWNFEKIFAFFVKIFAIAGEFYYFS